MPKGAFGFSRIRASTERLRDRAQAASNSEIVKLADRKLRILKAIQEGKIRYLMPEHFRKLNSLFSQAEFQKLRELARSAEERRILSLTSKTNKRKVLQEFVRSRLSESERNRLTSTVGKKFLNDSIRNLTRTAAFEKPTIESLKNFLTSKGWPQKDISIFLSSF